jgi:hypothetical protein
MPLPRRFQSGNKERDKIVVVIEKEAFGAMQKLNETWCETYQAVIQSTFDVQRHSVQYAQSIFTDGVETLQSHIEASQHWLQVVNKPQDQQESIPSFMESGVEAYKRNITFLQKTFEHGVETIKNNAEIMRDLTQTLIKKVEEQRVML